ncbi:GNAT family N-acetyltransferase [Knoellia aerolata]|uniref:N-acetyltransferase domain-containing protein n=1 Tax=Knoellia aerolata DSM 18566 TaxID=1385519 RepID=A0A0A0JJQ9_9MICO|nr:GNAT family N-acetyltransferase [Knoellia aerolata]KGN37635.1 hypothetical protein N801_00880 [Knoellia aerolata DSM 18566]
MDDLTPVRLRDGTEAFVVPLLPANREALREEYEHLSAETRFDRFLAPVPTLTDTMLDHLVCEVDGVDHVALVLLVITPDGTERPVGLARIIRYRNDPSVADVAVTVVDDWHGRGVATALLEVLMQHRPRGVSRIVTLVNASNRASLAMLRRLGEIEVSKPESGVQVVTVTLPDGADSASAGPGRVDAGALALEDSPLRRHDPPSPAPLPLAGDPDRPGASRR